MLILSGTVAVDTFFLLSGLLVSWSIFKEINRSNNLNVPLIYLHRYLRLTPALAALILFTLGIVKYTGDGPNWNLSETILITQCEKHWLSSLLYVQNYVNPESFVSLFPVYIL